MKKYGLQLRIQPQNRPPVRPPVARAPGFGDNDDDDEGDVNRDIARQATKKKVDKDIEELHKKALEEDPTVYDYDNVYEQMKEEAVRPLAQDRQERKSKYVQRLMEKAKEREREHEIIYERKLAKERSKDEHLFSDKDKFVTSAYKRKLAEQAKWLEEERLRELREERDDVTKKSDISDFYFNLSKNVAFGAKAAEASRQVKKEEIIKTDTTDKEILPKISSPSNSDDPKVTNQSETSHSRSNIGLVDVKTEINSAIEENTVAEQSSADRKEQDHHKKDVNSVNAAKERYLARKKAKIN